MRKKLLSLIIVLLILSAISSQAAFSEVLADGLPSDISGEVTVPSRTGRIDTHITLFSFASKDATVSYLLEGIDSEPVMLAIDKEYKLLEMSFVHFMLVFLGIGVLALSVRAFISHRTKAVIKQKQEYKEITGQIMKVAAAMTDSKSEYSAGHSYRVAEYSKLVGKRLGMSEEELETLYYAAMLHDIGNISVPDSILNKKGKLTDEEYNAMKVHVTIGAELLSEVSVIEGVALGARFHHERVDGKGYAEGLSGDDIPLIAKIICVCNAFDSMLSEKPYRKAKSVEEAQSELVHCAGTQFDERVTAILISLIHEGSVPL